MTVDRDGALTSMTLPDDQELTMYDYDELYGDYEYYQYFSYEIYLVPEDAELPDGEEYFYYDGDYI